MPSNPTTYGEETSFLLRQVEHGAAELFHGGSYQNYLRLMSRFYAYSTNNTILIYLQRPDATRLASRRTWERRQRHVKPGEPGIAIISCALEQTTRQVQRRGTDGVPLYDDQGTPVMDTVPQKVTRFRRGVLYDITQTEGPELPPPGTALPTWDEAQQRMLMNALIAASPVPVVTNESGRSRYDEVEQQITLPELRPNWSCIQTLLQLVGQALLEETPSHLARSVSTAKKRTIPRSPDPVTQAMERASVAYVVSCHLGIDAKAASPQFLQSVPAWSASRDEQQLKRSIEVIHSAAKTMIERTKQAWRELEQSVDRTAAPEQPAPQHRPNRPAAPTQPKPTGPVQPMQPAAVAADHSSHPGQPEQKAASRPRPAAPNRTAQAASAQPVEQRAPDPPAQEAVPLSPLAEPVQPHKKLTGEIVITPKGSFSVTSLNEKQMQQAGFTLHHLSADGKYCIMTDGLMGYAVQKPEVMHPQEHLTGELAKTSKGSFSVTSLSEEQMQQAGFTPHHLSEDGKYCIMTDGLMAYAVKRQEHPSKALTGELVETSKGSFSVTNLSEEQMQKKEAYAVRKPEPEKPAPAAWKTLRELMSNAARHLAQRKAEEQKPPNQRGN